MTHRWRQIAEAVGWSTKRQEDLEVVNWPIILNAKFEPNITIEVRPEATRQRPKVDMACTEANLDSRLPQDSEERHYVSLFGTPVKDQFVSLLSISPETDWTRTEADSFKERLDKRCPTNISGDIDVRQSIN
jgi:hypothetical protein